MMMVDIIHKQQSKLTMNIAMAKLYMRQGRVIIFATMDQTKTLNMLQQHFPKALFELVDTWGVKIHER